MTQIRDFVLVQTSLRWWILSAVFTVLVWTLVEGQPRVISPQTVNAALGADVVLQCHVVPEHDVQSYTIEWSRPDWKKDPSDPQSGYNFVLLYRYRQDVTDVKIKSFFNRTSLFTDSLKHGNASLQIREVTMEDQGTYRCYIPLLKSPVRQTLIQLVVDPDFGRTTEMMDAAENTVTPDNLDDWAISRSDRFRHGIWLSFLVFIAVFLAAGGGIYLYNHKCQGQNGFKNAELISA
ncbi:uncharacterized protein LOC117807196 [Notolabrus celidotus]|uniref:uncharacterized protein LOC117807196 n=1 Tax=Notolabrus celidotus TaxID=1203425 RepID=UPI0014902781|nr:uncharacterized protein LOC117807196 [Notolabrus celidotus]